jgi:hypothetical protein
VTKAVADKENAWVTGLCGCVLVVALVLAVLAIIGSMTND